jgi:hypothetical protein
MKPLCHILIPTLAGMCDPLENWLFGLAREPVIIEKLVQPNRGFLESARQQQANQFLAGPCDWALFIDSDSGPLITLRGFVPSAIKSGSKLVTGITPFHGNGLTPGVVANVAVKNPAGEYVNLPWHKIPWRGPRYQRVDVAGLSFCLIHREVIETLVNKAERGEDEYPFKAYYERGLMKRGEDRCFFERAIAAGYELVADVQARVAHDKHFCLTPEHAIYDLPFMSPGEEPSPDAPTNETVDPFEPEEPKRVQLVN